MMADKSDNRPITDAERRRLANDLRHAAQSECCDSLLNTLRFELEVDKDWRDVLIRLADLIEPGNEVSNEVSGNDRRRPGYDG